LANVWAKLVGKLYKKGRCEGGGWASGSRTHKRKFSSSFDGHNREHVSGQEKLLKKRKGKKKKRRRKI